MPDISESEYRSLFGTGNLHQIHDMLHNLHVSDFA